MLIILRIILLSVLSIPTFSFAENMLIDANVLFSIPDAGGNDNFHTGKTVLVNYNYYFKPWLSATGGVFFTEKISTYPDSDVVGRHQETIDSKGLTFGMRSEYKASERNKVYGRLGILYYTTELTVDEYFNPGVPVFSVTDTTDGYGYYAALAWAHSFTQQVSLQLELNTITQLNLFKGKTTTPFDLTNTGISIGVGYAF